MCNCEGCRIQGSCRLDPDISLNDALICGQLKTAPIIDMGSRYYNNSFIDFIRKERESHV